MRSRGVVRVLITLPIMIPGLLIGVSLLVLFTDVLKVQPGSSTAIVGQSVLGRCQRPEPASAASAITAIKIVPSPTMM